MWLECPLCLNRCEVEDETQKRICLCERSSSNGERMVPAPWDKYLDEKLWAMYAAHAPMDPGVKDPKSPIIDFYEACSDRAIYYAEMMLKKHKKRWSKKNG